MRNVTRRARVKGRVSPATVIASVALVFAMTGTGMAATGYRITSLWQIAPKVRHALRGERGRRGLQGVLGQQGPEGPQGPAGPGSVNWQSEYSVVAKVFLSPSRPSAEVVAACHPGDHLLHGGFGEDNATLSSSAPETADSNQYTEVGWIVAGILQDGASSGEVDAEAVCIN